MTHDFVLALLQLRKGSFGPDLSFMQKNQPVGKDSCAGHIMRDYDGAHLTFFLQIYNQAADFLRGNRVQSGGGLIEEENFRI